MGETIKGPVFEPWQPGSLRDGVSKLVPLGITQAWAMFIISQALANGRTATPIENVEVTISITDDAIFHMMRNDP